MSKTKLQVNVLNKLRDANDKHQEYLHEKLTEYTQIKDAMEQTVQHLHNNMQFGTQVITQAIEDIDETIERYKNAIRCSTHYTVEFNKHLQSLGATI